MGTLFSAPQDGEWKIVFLTVQYNEADRNSYFAGTDQGVGRLGGI